MVQDLPAGAPDVFVTLNPIVQPDDATVLRHLSLAHPVYSFAAYRAQKRLPEIQVRLVSRLGLGCGP